MKVTGLDFMGKTSNSPGIYVSLSLGYQKRKSTLECIHGPNLCIADFSSPRSCTYQIHAHRLTNHTDHNVVYIILHKMPSLTMYPSNAKYKVMIWKNCKTYIPTVTVDVVQLCKHWCIKQDWLSV